MVLPRFIGVGPVVSRIKIMSDLDVAERFRITLGVANLFDTPPPRVSTVVTATPPVIGQAPAFGTQYDYLGRRFFLSVRGSL